MRDPPDEPVGSRPIPGNPRRAGQGVASLQVALRMAGARSVITNSCTAPDETTREPLADSRRRTWIEKKPRRKALRAARMSLRARTDDGGRPKSVLRDWAAWILTGEPDGGPAREPGRRVQDLPRKEGAVILLACSPLRRPSPFSRWIRRRFPAKVSARWRAGSSAPKY